MTSTLSRFAACFLLVCFLALVPASAVQLPGGGTHGPVLTLPSSPVQPHHVPRSVLWIAGALAAAGLLGTVGTPTYAYPVSGTTAPTAAQAALVNVQTVQVNFADADTTGTITHNWAFSAAALARLEPLVQIYQNAGGTPSPLLIVTLATNTVVLTKQSTAAGSGGTVTVILQRPHSILMPNF
jgi:hypothetical protein